jgi:hypothetical protein
MQVLSLREAEASGDRASGSSGDCRESGERFPAKFGRTGFRRNFTFDSEWEGRRYATKQVEAYAVEDDGWLVITVVVKYF